jgi:Asp-tRNA(Asn)/Glu-tRNA(Gln) amidotransferase A subunit family amidase
LTHPIDPETDTPDAPETTLPDNAPATPGKKVKRRDFIKGLAAVGMAGASGSVTAAANGEQKPDAPTPDVKDAITAEDIAHADKLAGRAYSEKERQQMAREAGNIRKTLQTLRTGETDPLLAPAIHFEPRLPGMRVPEGKGSFRLSSAPTPAYNGSVESLAFATTVELSRLIRSGQVTSMQLTRMYLDRLKKYGPRLLCVVNLTEDLALAQAERADRELAAGHYRGPLHGIPWGAKDLLATKGIPTTWGAKPYEQQIFDYDATVTKRLEEAGAVLVAKLTMGELAMGDNWFGGITRNPWNATQGSSGSSAGPGSATAAGLVGFSIGTETLGSIVSPSVRNGVTGLRPTFGRVSRWGAMPLSWTMDKIGPMCRGVEDCALVLHAIYGPDDQDGTVADVPFRWNPTLPLKKLRVGVDQAAFDSVQTDATKADAKPNAKERASVYQNVLDTLRKLGVTLVPITLPRNKELYQPIAWITIDVEGAAAFDKLTASGKLDQLAQQADSSWPNTFRIGSTVPASDYLQAMRLRTRLQHEMADALKSVDCYVTVPFHGATLVYTNLTGHPTLITRCGMVEGVPQSIEFVGDLYQEAAILRLGYAYEQTTEWHKQWPDMDKLPPTPPKMNDGGGE